ncbi:hypothetical protein C8F04DRAFT_974348 [Mycena alexandri]|uniref:Uncharacterized protein n=1 Tax=Mycena alexandri TaxID=1745969 RepID=A0AAD6WPJ8_9AGAR|nr:hypothetical protein C8F04DRAFT_974348 [Mycena alexandri]
MTSRDWELYGRLLFPKGLGYPLFSPTVPANFPLERRKTGIKIGDVGYVRDGSFEAVFNILHDANDQDFNPWGVPPGFEKVVLSPLDIARLENVQDKRAHIASHSVQKQEIDLHGSAQVHACVVILVLPDGASREVLLPLESFNTQALKHAENWYHFVQKSQNRRVVNGDLYLITEVTKCKSWSINALELRVIK